MEIERVDLAVVGAGIFGLAMAKTFHQLNPQMTIAIFDRESSVGGVWSKHRHYPGLKSNNMVGTYEFPDFPMDEATFGVKPGEFIPAQVMHDYLSKYAEKFGILDKIRHCSTVSTAERANGPNGGWMLTVEVSNGETIASIKVAAKKLIVATGLTSEAVLPEFAGREEFEAPLFHTKDFLQHAGTLETAKRVAVFGGTKSAWDAVYAYASKGIKVDWIIRESGHGPTWMAPPYVTPLKKWLEKIVHTRMVTWFSPCAWGDADGYKGIRAFYHRTFLGRALTRAFWHIMGSDVKTLNAYDAHPETRKLKPWGQSFHIAGSSLSILNYPTSIFDLVRDGTVRVHIADIVHLEPHAVRLSDGVLLADLDALCCATGWRHVPPVRFLPEGLDQELGMPHVLDPNMDNKAASSEPRLWTGEAVQRADEEILARFPRLRRQPPENAKLKPLLDMSGVSSSASKDPLAAPSSSPSASEFAPFALYRFMVPASARLLRSHDIAFAGAMMTISTTMLAHAQAVWIHAYMEGRLPASVIPSLAALKAAESMSGVGSAGCNSSDSPGRAVGSDAANGPGVKAAVSSKSMEDVRRETVLHARFGRWRYPGSRGTRFPDFAVDLVPYLDLLMRDLGLPVHRKGGFLAEATKPYGPEDYRDLVNEYVSRQGLRAEH